MQDIKSNDNQSSRELPEDVQAPLQSLKQAGGTISALKARIEVLTESLRQAEGTNSGLKARIEVLTESLRHAEGTNSGLKAQVEYLRKLMFGRKSERIVCDLSLSPLLPGMEAAGMETADPDADPEKNGRRQEVAPHQRKAAERHDRKGWLGFPDSLPRETVDITLPPEQTEGLKIVGYAEHERLVHRSEYVVQIIRRAKYACPEEPLAGVVIAPAPENPLSDNSDRAHYDVTAYAHLIADKFVNHLPFHRQSKDLKRIGIFMDRGLMCAMAMEIARILQPLYNRLEEMLMEEPVIHADETPVRMLSPGRGECRKCHIWIRCSGSGSGIALFHFSEHRNHEVAEELLGDFRGTYVCDGYGGYSRLPGTRANCWAHARRKFFDAVPKTDSRRLKALALVHQMYGWEDKATEQAGQLGEPDALHTCRRDFRNQSAKLVSDYFELCREIVADETPTSPLAKAAAYALNLEEGLKRFLADPRVPVDNNLAERSVRPITLGRKNWMFVGNAQSGALTAVIFSMVSTCENNKVNFEAWLKDVLVRLPHTQAKDLDTLLPMNWHAEREQ